MIVVSAAEMRRLDELTIHRYGTPGHVLMERAGRGAARVLLARFPRVRRGYVLVCAGKGNNGGDGFVIARTLRRLGTRVEVVLLGTQRDVRGDAARMLASLRRTRAPITEVTSRADLTALAGKLDNATVLVDAIFGTGLNAPVGGRYADLIELMNASGVPIFAVDIPSGLDADRGTPLGVAIHADVTATFGFAKVGQVVYPGVEHVGTLAVVDIGTAAEAVAEVQPRTQLLEAAQTGRLIPGRAAQAHKGTCGHVLVIAGSRGRTGAALLATHAAARAGAGLTTLAGPTSLNAVLASGIPEAMTALLADTDGLVRFEERQMRALVEGKSAIVVGPGIGTHEDAGKLVRFLIEKIALPMVVDADALTCVARQLEILHGAQAAVLLTPHPGEMARLLGSDTASVQADRVATARTFAAEHDCTLVLKGARSVIAAADGTAWINPTGNPGMASGGMGDALAGILGGLLAQGLTPPAAARLGVYLHGAVADQVAATTGQIGLLASDVIAGIPAGLARLQAQARAGASPATRKTPAKEAAGRRASSPRPARLRRR